LKKILCLILLPLIAACSAVPFQETARVPLGPEGPRSLVERFQTGLPGSFQLLTSVVFEYNWRKFAAVGYLDINRRDGLFKVACLNPMGVKLFELSGDEKSVTNLYTIAAFNRYGDITTVVGNDIRRIYFDLVPSAEARIWKRKYSVSFRQPSGPGTMEYIFSGPQADLVEKNYYDDSGIAWRVSYYEYRDQNGKRFPQGIVLLNYQYHYRLTVRHKEYRS
jgi:hypothetical protein